MKILARAIKTFNHRRFLSFALTAILGLSGVGYLVYVSEVPPVMAQSAVDSLPDVVMPQSGQRILVFSPHPDDETIGVGGYIAQSREAGADVRIVLVTNGDFHKNEQVRYSEFRKATQILGVPNSALVFLGFPDRKLKTLDQATLYTALKSQIEQYNPDVVIYPHPRDANPDHSTIGKVVEEILRADSHKRTVYEYLVHYKLIWPRPREFAPALYLLPPEQLQTKDTLWEEFPLSQTNENLKSKAIFTYISQLDDRWLNGLLLSSIRGNELLAIPKNIYVP